MRTNRFRITVLLGAAMSVCAASACTATSGQAPSTPASGPASAPAPPVGPEGIGPVTLGMSYADAKKAGLVREGNPPGPGETCVAYRFFLDGAPTGVVGITAGRGVETVGAMGSATPQGIRAGSTQDDVHRAYPDADLNLVRTYGRTYAKVPGNPNATYRIGFDDDYRVHAVVLRFSDQGCFE